MRDPLASSPVLPEYLVYTGEGQKISWEEMTKEVLSADIILVGEQHDDPIGHKCELRLSKDLLEHSPAAALAMEMFERDEQELLNLYLDRKIGVDALIQCTGSSSWGGLDAWRHWYQPIVDVVREGHSEGAVLIAANAPSRYVRLARLEGFEPLVELKEIGNNEFELPAEVDEEDYKNRFIALMAPKSDPAKGHPMSMDTEAFFRAQQIWDATMAASVVSAKASHPKVMLLAGDFHISSQGGVLIRLQKALPGSGICSISIRRRKEELVIDKANAADYIIYTRSLKMTD